MTERAARASSDVPLRDLLADVPDAQVLPPAGETRDAALGRVMRALAVDSRAVRPDTLFACVRGTTADGHRFAADAVERGATALLVDTVLPDLPGVVQVRVADTRTALARAASAFHAHPSRALMLLGVTGTNGKTTTAYMMRAACEAAGFRTGVLGTVEYRLGAEARPAAHTTPDAIELHHVLAWMRDSGARVVACEVSSHALEQRRTYGTHFAVRAFTNLTRDHLDFHGTLDAYRAAKARFFRRADGGADDASVAVLNVDDPVGAAFAEETDYPTVRVSTRDGDVTAEDITLAPHGSRCVFRHAGGRTPLTLRMPAAHNIQNALVAFAAALAIGAAPDAAARGLSELAGVPGRLEPVHAGQPFAVLVDYAHTPDALERVLRAVRDVTPPGGRVLCVMGCGGDRDQGKRPLMGRLAATLADIAVITSDNPRTEDPEEIVRQVLSGVPTGAEVIAIVDRRAAIRSAIDLAHDGDTVLIAGKGHEDYQVLGATKIHFDDREEARAAIAARGFTSPADTRT